VAYKGRAVAAAACDKVLVAVELAIAHVSQTVAYANHSQMHLVLPASQNLKPTQPTSLYKGRGIRCAGTRISHI